MLNWEDKVCICWCQFKIPRLRLRISWCKAEMFFLGCGCQLWVKTQGLLWSLKIFTNKLLNWCLWKEGRYKKIVVKTGVSALGAFSIIVLVFLIPSFHCQPRITVQYMSFCLWSALTTVTAPQLVATCTFVNWPDSILFLNVWVMLQLLQSPRYLLFYTIWPIGGHWVIYKHNCIHKRE